jgi:hypothetical protein
MIGRAADPVALDTIGKLADHGHGHERLLPLLPLRRGADVQWSEYAQASYTRMLKPVRHAEHGPNDAVTKNSSTICERKL